MAVLVLALLLGSAEALEPDEETRTLTVGLTHSPPFTLHDPDGAHRGLAVELWEGVAEDLELSWRYEPMELAELLAAVEVGEVDVGLAPLTVTAERERVLDFTHAFHATGLGVATVPTPAWRTWFRVVQALMSAALLQFIVALTAVLLVVGSVVSAVERRRNPDHFGGTWFEALFSGFWWSAVTMTTVGYGDKAPRTVPGRLLALVWMFAGLVIVSSFTAAVVAALSDVRDEGFVRGPADLEGVTTGTVEGSTSAAWLQQHRHRHLHYTDPAEAMAALAAGEVSAVVYDKPILLHLAMQHDGEVQILPHVLDEQLYALALPQGSPLRAELNVALLERMESTWWSQAREAWLGR